MRSFDLSPLYRTTVGFDRLFSLFDDVGASGPTQGYPRYNIEKTGENDYRVTIAVAGFAEGDLAVELDDQTLIVRGAKAPQEAAAHVEVLFQGIAARAFERRFQLAESVSVAGAKLENGLLHVELKREVPEAKKPKLIPIGNGAAAIEARH